ncbi:M48 family metallopeptidase [Arenimonas composti]|uniref:Uncharacterized protein n=1 Tax=Arenimonas composti TR7-09 = DSM 18010 TaxID=1121013 RepID=A0A091BF86_9GAMM|nr:M48 family metallopeptidase [Arenimonas composti]KFN50217.1 hypothetical protein P873_07620 [Arenimonas composti TR7-09 = DSM 18010]
MSELPGTWFDGRSSRPQPVRLSQPAPGRLRLAAHAQTHEFDVRQLELSPRLGRMERILTVPGQGQVHLDDSPLLDDWLPRRDRVERWAHWLEGRRLVALASGLLTAVGAVLFFTIGLPWMAVRVAPLIPPAVERQIGDHALAIVDLQLRPSRLPAERRAALQDRFAELVAGLPREADYRLDFRYAAAIGPNAFALPGGQILMTDQLVELAERDEELLAVLAHEAGHHEHRHGLRGALEDSAVLVVIGFMFGDVSGAGSLSVSVPTLLLQTGFSRDHETEADTFAFVRLRDVGISPEHFATIMERMADHHAPGRKGDGEGPMGYLSTHPPTPARIAAARAAASSSD